MRHVMNGKAVVLSKRVHEADELICMGIAPEDRTCGRLKIPHAAIGGGSDLDLVPATLCSVSVKDGAAGLIKALAQR